MSRVPIRRNQADRNRFDAFDPEDASLATSGHLEISHLPQMEGERIVVEFVADSVSAEHHYDQSRRIDAPPQREDDPASPSSFNERTDATTSIYVVEPMDPQPIDAYVSPARALGQRYVLNATSPEQAAKAMIDKGLLFLVDGPEGKTVIDLTPVDGRETLSLNDEGPHR